ncbi:hypothetical protein [Sphingobium aromaticiconvertens]|uniref:hypothetical protein n=1 Tax=Sphingobium aromaticiconvertens TaxID=365341 RepID=UPI0030176E81
MKFVKLAQPTVVDGVLRQPIEGEIPTSDKEAIRLFDNNLLDGEPSDFPDSDDNDDADDAADLKKLSVPDLHILVEKESVALSGVTKKDAIIAAIIEHRAGKADA